MYRNGRFENLIWDRLTASHKESWEKLSLDYHLIAPTKIVQTEDNPEPILDLIAEACIENCRDYLFSMKHLNDISGVVDSSFKPFNHIEDFPDSIRTEMYQYFKSALCDHLIVTFAYCFYCENLEPKSFNEYAYSLFDSIAEPVEKIDNIIVAEKRKNYRKTMSPKYRNFCKQFNIVDIFENSEDAVEPQDEGASSGEQNVPSSDRIYPETVLDFFAYQHGYSEEETVALSDKIRTKLDPQRIPPPAGWFLIFCADRKLKYLQAILSSRTPYRKISTLLSSISPRRDDDPDIHKADISSALFPIEIVGSRFTADITLQATRIPAHLALYHGQKSDVFFAGTPVSKENCSSRPLLAQKCFLKASYNDSSEKREITIPTKIQHVFNFYLLERNFHIFSITCAEHIQQSKMNTDTYFPEWTACFLAPLRLRAPLLHADFLKYLIDRPEIMERRILLNRYFSLWNRIGLPILEEYFLKYIKENFDSIDSVFAAIEDSFLKSGKASSRYERLTRIRILLLPDEDEDTSVSTTASKGKVKVDLECNQTKEEKRMQRNTVLDTFLIAQGLEFRTDWSSRLPNWQLANDTPIDF